MTSKLELKVITLLRSGELTRDMDTQHLKKMASIAEEASFSADKIIYRRGDEGQAIYFIEEGEVVIEMEVPERGLVIMNRLGPGDMFGWSSLFPSERKMAWTRSVKPTKAFAFSAAKLRKNFINDQEFEYALVRRAARATANRIKANRQQLVDMMSAEKP